MCGTNDTGEFLRALGYVIIANLAEHGEETRFVAHQTRRKLKVTGNLSVKIRHVICFVDSHRWGQNRDWRMQRVSGQSSPNGGRLLFSIRT